jgi:hypothetical protein
VLGSQFVGELQLSGELDGAGSQTTVVGEEGGVVGVGGMTICWMGVVTGVLTIVTGLTVALVVTVVVTTAAEATAVEALF